MDIHLFPKVGSMDPIKSLRRPFPSVSHWDIITCSALGGPVFHGFGRATTSLLLPGPAKPSAVDAARCGPRLSMRERADD